jgi:hypothetical protein
MKTRRDTDNSGRLSHKRDINKVKSDELYEFSHVQLQLHNRQISLNQADCIAAGLPLICGIDQNTCMSA